MNIYEALKSEENDIRLTNGTKDRWLVWGDTGEWQVWQRRRYERQSACIYEGDSCDEAIQYLLGEAK